MIYNTTHHVERITFHPEDYLNQTHFFELIKSGDAPTFTLTACCEEDWIWEFWLEDPSIYERIKYAVMDVAAMCDNMYQAMEILDDLFWEYFEEDIVEDCDGDCENCEFN